MAGVLYPQVLINQYKGHPIKHNLLNIKVMIILNLVLKQQKFVLQETELCIK